MNRRRFLATVVSAGGVGLAGCAEKQSFEEHLYYNCKTHQTLAENESLGARFTDEQWRITVTNVSADGAVDIEVSKVLLDEVGQNKEGTDARMTFERSDIEPGSVEKIEGDFRVWHIDDEHEDAHLCVGLSAGDERDEYNKSERYA